MTVSEAIIKWLKEFNPAEYWKMKKIDTEQQSPHVDSYSLAKEPVQNVKPYLSGKKVYTDHYTFRARLSSSTLDDRIDNNGFGEAVENWVRKKASLEEYPELTDAVVKSIDVTTPFYVGRTDSNSFVYQMTIAIEYEKEK